MAPGTKDPKVVTFYGRLSYPTWTAQAAYERSLKGQYPQKDVASTSPDFTLVVEQEQLDKVRNHVLEEFFPYALEQSNKGEKNDALTQQEIDALTAQITSADFSGAYNTPFKPVPEKTQELAPECVASIKVIGPKGGDFVLRAIARSEDDLRVPDPEILKWPALVPLDASVYDMYPGCYVGVTLNLYAYHNGKNPGFSAGGSHPVFRADADRFGGGVQVDEDEIFLD